MGNTLDRRAFLKKTTLAGLAAFSGSLMTGCNSVEKAQKYSFGKRPNIVLVVTDDQGMGDLSWTGNKILKTPNLDRFALESTRLNNFIVSPLCAPTRASLMTGRYNYRTGIWDTWMGRMCMHSDEVTVADVLKDNGYATGIFGKWHLGDSIPMRPQDRGFEDTLQWVDSIGSRFDPEMELNGKIERMEGFIDDICTDVAIDFIEKNADRPFFAYVPFFMPHDHKKPQVPQKYIDMYEDAVGLKQGDKEVYAMVSNLDENFGRLMRKLKQLNIEEDTLVIFISDNGPLINSPDLESMPEILACGTHDYGYRYNAGLRGGKTNVYEGGIKVPCFMRWPKKFKANRDLSSMAAHIDIMPTLLSFAGVKKWQGPEVDGIDLSRMLLSNSSIPDRSIFIQSDRVEKPRPWHNACVREKKWKLIDDRELYDLENDPAETENLYDKHSEVVKRLKKQYDKWYADVTKGDPFVPGLTVIGSPKQKQVRFSIYHHHSVGFPLKVIDKGPYRITVKGIQKDLFNENSKMELKFKNKKFVSTDIDTEEQITFNNVILPIGSYNFDIHMLGYKKMSKMYYGNEDFGYRRIQIELLE